MWGVYEAKPVSQDHWEELLGQAMSQLPDPDDWDRAVAAATSGVDTRPHIFEYNTGTWLLLDSGAAKTIIPRAHCPQTTTLDPQKMLQTVNGQKIPTYGTVSEVM